MSDVINPIAPADSLLTPSQIQGPENMFIPPLVGPDSIPPAPDKIASGISFDRNEILQQIVISVLAGIVIHFIFKKG